jgi:hypothetical protein
MSKCIKRFISLIILVISIAVVCLNIPTKVDARAPRSKRVYLAIEDRYADPGEDPHLRYDLNYPTMDGSGQGEGYSASSSSSLPETLDGHQAAYTGNGKSYSRVKIKLMILARFALGVYLR